MERIQFINVSRVLWCCADRGITVHQLAQEVGIAITTINGLLEGNGLTFNQLKKIAEYFGRGILFFLEEGAVEPEAVHTTAFRTLANQKPELSHKLKLLIERVERQRNVYLGLNEDLGYESPQFNPPNIQGLAISEAARVVRLWLGLGEGNSFDTYRKALEAKGILVFRSNGYNGNWQIARESPIIGFALYSDVCPVIVIKKQSSDTQQSFTLMHELGHLLLHRASSIDDSQDLYAHAGVESEANAFAGNLLVPDTFLRLIADAGRPRQIADLDGWLDVYRRQWGVSVEVILRRLLDSGRLERDIYHAYREWRAQQTPQIPDRGSRQYRYREPGHMFGEHFVKTVLDSLESKNISLVKASKYLDNLNVQAIHRLKEHYYVRN